MSEYSSSMGSASGDAAERAMLLQHQQQQQDNDATTGLDRWLAGLFGVLYTVSKEKAAVTLPVACVRLIIDWLQVFLIAFNPAYGFVANTDSWAWKAFSFITLDDFLRQRGYDFMVALMYVFIFGQALSFAMCAYVGWSFKNNRFDYVWPVKLLRLYAVIFYQTLDIASMYIFLTPLACRYNSDTALTHVFFPDVVCFQGAHIIHVITGVCSFLVFMTFASLFVMADMDMNIVSRSYLAQMDTRVELRCFLIKTLMTCASVFLHPGLLRWLAAILLACTTGLVVLTCKWLPMTHAALNYARAASYSTTFLVSCVLAAMAAFPSYVNAAAATYAMWGLFVPTAAAACGAVWTRYRYIDRRVKEYDDGVADSRHIEIAAKRIMASSSHDSDSDRVRAATALLKQGVERLPKDPAMSILFAAFMIHVHGAHQTGFKQLEVAKRHNCGIRDLFAIFSIEQEQAQRACDGADLVSYVELQKNYRLITQSHSAALRARQAFWSYLLKHNLSLATLARLVKDIDTAVRKADQTYKQVLPKYGTHVAIIRLYAKFLEHVKQDPWSASKWRQEAERIELDQEQSRDPTIHLLDRAASPETVALVAQHRNDPGAAAVVINAQCLIEVVNDAFLELFNFTKADVQRSIRLNINVIIPPGIRDAHNHYVRQFIAGDRVSSLLGASRELLAVTKDGYTFPVQALVHKVSGIGEDTKFMGILRAVPVPDNAVLVWTMRGSPTIMCVSQSFEQVLGFKNTEVLGRPLDEFVDVNSNRAHHKYIEEPLDVQVESGDGGVGQLQFTKYLVLLLRPPCILVSDTQGRLLHISLAAARALALPNARELCGSRARFALEALMPEPLAMLHRRVYSERHLLFPHRDTNQKVLLNVNTRRGMRTACFGLRVAACTPHQFGPEAAAGPCYISFLEPEQGRHNTVAQGCSEEDGEVGLVGNSFVESVAGVPVRRWPFRDLLCIVKTDARHGVVHDTGTVLPLYPFHLVFQQPRARVVGTPLRELWGNKLLAAAHQGTWNEANGASALPMVTHMGVRFSVQVWTGAGGGSRYYILRDFSLATDDLKAADEAVSTRPSFPPAFPPARRSGSNLLLRDRLGQQQSVKRKAVSFDGREQLPIELQGQPDDDESIREPWGDAQDGGKEQQEDERMSAERLSPVLSVDDEVREDDLKGRDEAAQMGPPDSDYKRGKRFKALARRITSDEALRPLRTFRRAALAAMGVLLAAKVAVFVCVYILVERQARGVALLSAIGNTAAQAVLCGTHVQDINMLLSTGAVPGLRGMDVEAVLDAFQADLDSFVALHGQTDELIGAMSGDLRSGVTEVWLMPTVNATEYYQIPANESAGNFTLREIAHKVVPASLRDLGSLLIAKASNVLHNWNRTDVDIFPSPGHWAHWEDAAWVIQNTAYVMPDAYMQVTDDIMLTVIRTTRDISKVQTVCIVVFALLCAALVVGVCASAYSLMRRRHALYSVFVLVPTAMLRALVSRSTELQDEDEWDADGAGDQGHGAHQGSGEDSGAALAAPALTDYSRVATMSFSQHTGPRKKQLTRSHAAVWAMSWHLWVVGAVDTLIAYFAQRSILSIDQPITMFTIVNYVRIKYYETYALVMRFMHLTSHGAEALVGRRDSLCIHSADLKDEYTRLLYGSGRFANATGLADTHMPSRGVASLGGSGEAVLFSSPATCETEGCMNSSNPHYAWALNGLDGLVTQYLKVLQITCMQDGMDPVPEGPEFAYMWEVRTEMRQGLLRLNAVYEQYVHASYRRVQTFNALALTLVCAVVTAFYVLTHRPRLQEVNLENKRIAELMSELPEQLNVEAMLTSAQQQQQQQQQQEACQV